MGWVAAEDEGEAPWWRGLVMRKCGVFNTMGFRFDCRFLICVMVLGISFFEMKCDRENVKPYDPEYIVFMVMLCVVCEIA